MDNVDVSDSMDVAATNAGLIIAVPAGLSLLWIFACFVIIVGRSLLQEPVVTAALQWDATAFAGSTTLGILLCMTRSCWLCGGTMVDRRMRRVVCE